MRTFSIKPVDKPISVIGMGTMIFHPDTQDRDSQLLDAFIAGGGTYIDTAEVYGAVEERGYSEMVIGEWLASRPGMREKVVLTTKGLIPGYCAPIHPGGAKIDPASIHKAIAGSLERLKVDYLDMWMFHRDDLTHPVGPLVDALDEEVKSGRIRSYGGSNWTTARIQEAIDYAQANEQGRDGGVEPQLLLGAGQRTLLAGHRGHDRGRPGLVRRERLHARGLVGSRTRLLRQGRPETTPPTPTWSVCSTRTRTSPANDVRRSSPRPRA